MVIDLAVFRRWCQSLASVAALIGFTSAASILLARGEGTQEVTR